MTDRSLEALVAIVGPTGTGKSALAMSLAEMLDGEIVSVDSAQVFRGLDIGTAKPSREEQVRVPHHVIDTIEPVEQWSAADYQKSADQAIAGLRVRDKLPIVCGGTGLWLRALVRGIFAAPAIDEDVRRGIRERLVKEGAPALHAELARVDPEAAARIQPTDPQRIGRALEVFEQTGVPISTHQREHGFNEDRYRLIAFGIRYDRDALAARLALRVNTMYEAGLLEEVRSVLGRGVPADAPGLSTIGYKEATSVIAGALSESEGRERTAIATRRFAKRQRNWFRGVSELEWVEPDTPVKAVRERLLRRLSEV